MYKRILAFLTVGVLAVGVPAAGPARGQAIGIGATKGGAAAQIAAAIAKVVSSKTKLDMRVRPMDDTQQIIRTVNAGELDFGLSNLPQYWMAKIGIGLSKRSHPNLRLAANLMVFQVGLLVAGNSTIKTVADLKGKRVPSGFKEAPLFDFIVRGFLANGGLGYSDVTTVPVADLRKHWSLMAQGNTDLAIAAVGAARVRELNDRIAGGARFVSLDNSEAAVKALRRVYPKTYLKLVKPDKRFIGVRDPVYTLNYDYLAWVNKDVPDEVVYQVVKAMHENEMALKDSSPLWRSFNANTMAKDHGTPYHVGALKLYKEVGLLN